MLALVVTLGFGAAVAAAPPAVQLEVPAAASSYRTDRPTPPEQRELAAAAASRWPGLQWSPGLVDAARVWAASTADLGAVELPPSFLEMVLLRTGNPEPTAVASAVTAAALEEVFAHVDTVLSSSPVPLTNIGIGRVDDSGSSRWGLVLSRRPAHLGPFPSSVRPGSFTELSFTLAAGFSEPEVVVVAAGETLRMVVRRAGEGWTSEVRAPPVPGSAWVMVRARMVKGDAIAAQLEVGVGEELPRVWRGAPIPEEDPPLPVAEAEAVMVELVNRDRERHGLRALTPDPELAAVARAHSHDMLATGFFAHESPTHGNLTARLAAADYPAVTARENLSRSSTVHGAQSALMASLTHRANLLAGEVTHLGVGLAVDRNTDERPAYLVTQIFATRVTPRSAEELRWIVARELSRRRRGAGVPPLRTSDDLDRRAAAYIRDGALDLDPIRDAGDVPCDERPRWSTVHALLLEFDRFADVDLPESVTTLDLTHFGVAIVQRSGGYGPHSKVALLIAQAVQTPAVDRVDARLERRLAALRTEHGLGPLRRSEVLDREARRLAEAGAGGLVIPGVDATRVQAELADAGTPAGGLVTVGLEGTDARGLSIPAEALDPGVARFGLGIARRVDPDCASVDTVVLLLARAP